jgi:hypothetical protein
MARLGFSATAQTLVQLQSPDRLRGPLIGAFIMTQMGMQAVSGLSLGVLGTAIGLHEALTLSGLLAAGLSVLFLLAPRGGRVETPRLAPVAAGRIQPPEDGGSCC